MKTLLHLEQEAVEVYLEGSTITETAAHLGLSRNAVFNRLSRNKVQTRPSFRRTINPVTRFWQHVDTTTACWLWLGATDTSGYGRYNTGKGIEGAHRFAWMITNNSFVPKGLHICHTCDNRLCVTPEHLWVGTANDNMQDMIQKGRGFWQR